MNIENSEAEGRQVGEVKAQNTGKASVAMIKQIAEGVVGLQDADKSEGVESNRDEVGGERQGRRFLWLHMNSFPEPEAS
jgi:hypothetical protein